MGLKALTRELHADERPQLLAHLLALDAEDRRLRFAHALSDDGVRHYVEGIDLSRGAVFVVTDAILRSLARPTSRARTDMPNLAFPSCRGTGAKVVGGALLERCAARARNWGMRVMFMNCLVENAAMMHLARKQDLKIAVSGAEAEAFVRLPRADLTSLAADAVAEHLGYSTTPRNPIGWRCKPSFRNEQCNTDDMGLKSQRRPRNSRAGEIATDI